MKLNIYLSVTLGLLVPAAYAAEQTKPSDAELKVNAAQCSCSQKLSKDECTVLWETTEPTAEVNKPKGGDLSGKAEDLVSKFQLPFAWRKDIVRVALEEQAAQPTPLKVRLSSPNCQGPILEFDQVSPNETVEQLHKRIAAKVAELANQNKQCIAHFPTKFRQAEHDVVRIIHAGGFYLGCKNSISWARLASKKPEANNAQGQNAAQEETLVVNSVKDLRTQCGELGFVLKATAQLKPKQIKSSSSNPYSKYVYQVGNEEITF